MATETWPSDVTIESNLLDQQQKAWTLFKLGDLGKAITGITPPMADNDQLDVIPFITPAEITGSFNGIKPQRWFHSKYRHVARIVPANTILMVCIGSVGKCSLTDQEVGYNQQINALILDQSKAFPPFVLAIFLSPIFKKQLNSKISCTAIPILNLTAWCSLNIPLPPLEEQQRIGALFKELDRNISLNRALLDKLTKLKTSLLEQMFPGAGKSVPQLRFEGFTSTWTTSLLGDISTKISDGVHNLPPPAKVGAGTPILSAKDIDDFGNLLFNNVNRYAAPKDFQIEQKRNGGVVKGDLLLTIVGSIGRVTVVETEHRFMLQRSVAIVKPNLNLICSDFLQVAISHPLTKTWLQDTAAGSNQKGIYLSKLETMQIQYPSLAEQQRIGAFFKAMDERIAQQRAKLSKLEQLKQALLGQMFVSAPI